MYYTLWKNIKLKEKSFYLILAILTTFIIAGILFTIKVVADNQPNATEINTPVTFMLNKPIYGGHSPSEYSITSNIDDLANIQSILFYDKQENKYVEDTFIAGRTYRIYIKYIGKNSNTFATGYKGDYWSYASSTSLKDPENKGTFNVISPYPFAGTIDWTGEFVFDLPTTALSTSFEYQCLDEPTYSISFNKFPPFGKSGKPTASQTQAKAGTTITIQANPDTGFYLDRWESSDVYISKNSFTMPEKNVTINAYYGSYDYRINVNSSQGGTANASVSSAKYESLVSLSYTCDTGYAFDGWQSADVTINNDQFTMPAKEVTIMAMFSKQSYPITVNTAEGGSASSSPSMAYYGDNVTLSYACDEGYKLDGWQSDEVTIIENQFTMPAQAVNVIPIFSKIKYTVNLTQTEGGEIKANPASAFMGDTINLEYEANEDYEFKNWMSEDVEISDNQFIMPADNVSISAKFEKKPIAPEEEKKETIYDDIISQVVNNPTDTTNNNSYNNVAKTSDVALCISVLLISIVLILLKTITYRRRNIL